MWHPKDVATWLALIALILIIPFNFFTSWAYPKLQNWWAARSRKSLQKRIDKLAASLPNMNQVGMRISDELVLMCAEQLASIIFWGTTTLMFFVMYFTMPLIHPIHHPKLFGLVPAILFAVFKGVKDFSMLKIGSYRRDAGPLTRMDLEYSIDRLSAKLAAREHQHRL